VAHDHPILALQRLIGNQAVQRLIQRSEDEIQPPSDPWEGWQGENQGPPMPQEDGGFIDINNPNQSYHFASDVEDAYPAQPQQPADPWEGWQGENQGPPMPQEDGSLMDINNPNQSYYDIPPA
jgi:hypothetical protein